MTNMQLDTIGMLEIPAASLIGQSVAILGIKGSGKSNTAAVLMEELLAAGIPICVVDIAGEYHTLKEKFENISVVGKSLKADIDVPLSPDNARDIAEKIYTNGFSSVVDISGLRSAPSKRESGDVTVYREDLLEPFFDEIWHLAARLEIPTVIFLEEAHNWIPQSRGSTPSLRNLFVDIAAEGRKRGLSLIMIGQRSARIHKDTLTQADIAFLHRVRHPTDLKVYTDMIPRAPRWVRDRVYKLKNGEALVLHNDQVLRPQMRLRVTRHVGSTPTMANIPQSAQLSLLDFLDGIST